MPGLTIFGAGSYGRHEASTHSDIDLFFLIDGKNDAIPEPRTSSLRLFAKVIETVDLMSFPKLSNDCEYLELLSTADILYHLGSRTDDSANYFTARMLLLLEGQCLHGSIVYEKVLKDVVDSYFNDFPDHKQTFSPMFLVNDICRFWKTMLLNYENRRGLRDPAAATEDRKTKHKVRNFKLKFSRMTTCFASVAALGSFSAPVTPEQVIQLVRMTPRARLMSVSERISSMKPAVQKVLAEYEWFLEMTGQPTTELEAHFSDVQKRRQMFERAIAYGDLMYGLLQAIDATDGRLKLIRNIAI